VVVKLKQEKIIVHYKGTPADAEVNLEKAVDSIRLNRERSGFRDNSLKSLKQKIDVVVQVIFDSIIQEVEGIINK
jgi:hypothetical protein